MRTTGARILKRPRTDGGRLGLMDGLMHEAQTSLDTFLRNTMQLDRENTDYEMHCNNIAKIISGWAMQCGADFVVEGEIDENAVRDMETEALNASKSALKSAIGLYLHTTRACDVSRTSTSD